MEALRHSLLAPAGGTFFMIFGCISAMQEMIGARYAVKDDNDKPLLPHPYQPWTSVDPKYKEQTDRAFRGFKMYENVKEWTLMSLPVMWTFSVYGGALPYVRDNTNIMDGIVVASWVAYCYANHQYIKGYMDSPDARITGFKRRLNVVKFWLFGTAASIGFTALQKFGIVE